MAASNNVINTHYIKFNNDYIEGEIYNGEGLDLSFSPSMILRMSQRMYLNKINLQNRVIYLEDNMFDLSAEEDQEYIAKKKELDSLNKEIKTHLPQEQLIKMIALTLLLCPNKNYDKKHLQETLETLGFNLSNPLDRQLIITCIQQGLFDIKEIQKHYLQTDMGMKINQIQWSNDISKKMTVVFLSCHVLNEQLTDRMQEAALINQINIQQQNLWVPYFDKINGNILGYKQPKPNVIPLNKNYRDLIIRIAKKGDIMVYFTNNVLQTALQITQIAKNANREINHFLIDGHGEPSELPHMGLTTKNASSLAQIIEPHLSKKAELIFMACYTGQQLAPKLAQEFSGKKEITIHAPCKKINPSVSTAKWTNENLEIKGNFINDTSSVRYPENSQMQAIKTLNKKAAK